jgi:hypothetical protein
VNCSGMACTSAAGTAFGPDDVEIATATATAGSWDSTGVIDLRGIAGKDRVVCSTFLTQSDVGGTRTCGLDAATFGFKLNPGFGANLAAAATITPTNRAHHVTGTTTVQTISAANLVDGENVSFMMDSTAAFGTAGNINAARSGAAGLVMCVYSTGSNKWYCTL